MDEASRNFPLHAAEKKGDMQSTSSCAAKRRCSRPTTRVIIEDVRLLGWKVSECRCDVREMIVDLLVQRSASSFLGRRFASSISSSFRNSMFSKR